MPLILICAGASLFFCSKAVFVKCAYRHGADYLTVLTLRMVFSLPFFVVTGMVAARNGRNRETPGGGRLQAGNVEGSSFSRRGLPPRDWAALAGLGFLGYYLSSVLNFAGLTFISVGLERIVLYSYPTLVVLGGALFFRRPLRRPVLLASLAAWLGIAVAFLGEAGHRPDGAGEPERLAAGAGLVFASALTYGAFILLSGELLQRVGAAVFTSVVVGFSAVFVLVHYLAVRQPETLFSQPAAVYGWSVVLAVVGTVIPGYLMGLGVAGAGAARFAIIGTSGPVMTVLLAWLILGEKVNAAQAVGFVLSLAGGLTVSLLKDGPPRAATGAPVE